MDPVTIFATVVALSQACGQAISGIDSLRGKWTGASLSLMAIASECAVLQASLALLRPTISAHRVDFESGARDNSATPLFGKHGVVTYAINDLICSSTMTLSELNDEIASIRRNIRSNGRLDLRGKAKYVLDETRIQELATLIRGQSLALTNLQTALQSESRREMREILLDKKHDSYSVYKQSKKSWRRHNQHQRAPKNLAEAGSLLPGSDSISLSSNVTSTRFDFDDEIVNSDVYRNAMRNRMARNDTSVMLRQTSESPSVVKLYPLDLVSAVKRGDLDAVAKLLDDGEDPNVPDKSGLTPLHRCAESKSEFVGRIATRLASHGANIDFHHQNSGMTPLRYAVQRGNLQLVKALVGLGADLSIKGKLDQQAIHVAVQFNHPDIALVLLEEGARQGVKADVLAAFWDDEGERRVSGCNLLHFTAIGSADADMVDLLLQHGSNPVLRSSDGKSPLIYAYARRNIGVSGRLEHHGLSIVADLLRAAERGTLEGEWCQSWGLSIDLTDKDGRTAASRASERNSHIALQCLLEHGASATLADRSGMSPLQWAASLVHIDTLEVIGKQPDINLSETTVNELLDEATSSLAYSESTFRRLIGAFKGSFNPKHWRRVLRHAIQKGWESTMDQAAHANAGDADLTLVSLAAQANYFTVVDVLLETECLADGNTKSKLGAQLRWATLSQSRELVEAILTRGADPLYEQAGCLTPFAIACQSGLEGIVGVFLDQILGNASSDSEQPVKANLGERLKDIKYFDHILESNSKSIVKLLVSRGLNLSDYTIDGLPALVYALSQPSVPLRFCSEVLETMVILGANPNSVITTVPSHWPWPISTAGTKPPHHGPELRSAGAYIRPPGAMAADSEKSDKQFNWHHPTATQLDSETLVFNCFPSFSYKENYASPVIIYLSSMGKDASVVHF
ncbi:ankyrin [Thozetella sp. PMI_491]|nr:ankyrin [Thozetella sp. PMI_491]